MNKLCYVIQDKDIEEGFYFCTGIVFEDEESANLFVGSGCGLDPRYLTMLLITDKFCNDGIGGSAQGGQSDASD